MTVGHLRELEGLYESIHPLGTILASTEPGTQERIDAIDKIEDWWWVNGPKVIRVLKAFPLLLDALEALEQAVLLEYDPKRTDAENDELQRRGREARVALAAFEEIDWSGYP